MASTKTRAGQAQTRQTSAGAGTTGGHGATVDVTRETLEATPARVVVFLRGLGTSITLRSVLAQRGYTPAEHRRGWHLLHEASGFESSLPDEPPPDEDTTASQAVATLDDWDESGLRIVSAALRHRHPDQHAYVLDGLTASRGASAVVGVRKLLDRIDALQSGKGRPAGQRAGDRAALATLTARGIDDRERARLRTLVTQAESYGAVSDLAARQSDSVTSEEEHLATLRDLRAWYEEWSDIARAVIKRRDHLLRLGLAQLKPRKTPTP